MTEVWLALIVACSSVVTIVVQGWQRRLDRVAIRDELESKQAEVKAELAKDRASTNGQLEEIHTLVNSNMTAAKQAELSATRRELVLIKRSIVRNGTDGLTVSVEDAAAIKAAEGRISELTAELEDRAKATDIAEQAKKA